ncbi:MAG TPA: hypothetical protein PLT82_08145 [Candidatus Hydrogenedens sp.]|nr:hypothetical protein [Candidatus Hydrogenedens sp.]HOL18764.1 hypothetical protein [Candidatus Hydrogenedens sp.]HPP59086.1 hypothetical protein [Candidatus Hydrogenedens sp.]
MSNFNKFFEQSENNEENYFSYILLSLLVKVSLYSFPGICFLMTAFLFLPSLVDELLGAGRKPIPHLSWGEAGPKWNDEVLLNNENGKLSYNNDYAKEFIESVAKKPLVKAEKRSSSPYICLAKLACGKDVEEVNKYLQELKPWSYSGSSWFLFKGDYDFTEVVLTRIMYLFGDNPKLIYQETLEHVLNVGLVEEGGKPRIAVPKSLGWVRDTENHHLMTESSRYLKNQWLFKYGSSTITPGKPEYDNKTNGLERWLIDYLEDMLMNGEYEFNSIPYLLYAVQALLNLEEFPDSTEIRVRAHKVLDSINWKYALGSLQFRRCAPFRRRFEYADTTSLVIDPHTALMRWWCLPESDNAPGKEMTRHSRILFAVLSPYTVPPIVKKWASEKPHDYFVQIGYGENGTPEIYSGGTEYLISAGGVYRGLRAMIIPRPTTLLLNDREVDINKCFHIKGKGKWWCWNNTGVYKRFAVGNSPVSIPPQYTPVAQKEAWFVFAPECASGLYVCVYNDEKFGLLYLPDRNNLSPNKLLSELINKNPSREKIYSSFVFLDDNKIEYDVNAPAGMWVIKSINGETINRNCDTWSRWNGNIPTELYTH